MPVYRRRDSSDMWHWCKNCSNFPTKQGYETSYVKPTSGELCNECKSKADEKTLKFVSNGFRGK